MKLSAKWLSDWAQAEITAENAAAKFNMAGLEVDNIVPVADDFAGVLVGRVVEVAAHPNADKLSVCTIDVSGSEHLSIVCGASNVRAGLHVPVAVIGAVLPGNFKIKKAKLRGVASQGMICSEQELGIAESSNGIMELPADAPVGDDLRVYLDLDDKRLDIDLTANRGDCLSVIGLARELAALTGNTLKEVPNWQAAPTISSKKTAHIRQPQSCPVYLTRVITKIDNSKVSPLWLREYLRRSDIRPVSLVVDITQYVMLLLGQPMHAFDADKISGDLTVRRAHNQESLTLLNEQTISLDANDLVIADDTGAVALAGIMGGQSTAVTASTSNIVLESAYFTPSAIQGRARKYGLHTDSSHRFERGTDFKQVAPAIELASQLLLNLGLGQAGDIYAVTSHDDLPKPAQVQLAMGALKRVLGREYSAEHIESLLAAIGCQVTAQSGTTFNITPPSWRYDLTEPVDFVEEIARLDGYHNIPASMPTVKFDSIATNGPDQKVYECCQLLQARSFDQIISYSFISKDWADQFASGAQVHQLTNPISQDLAVMRPSLLPGLLQTVHYNVNRQCAHARFYEHGRCFIDDKEVNKLAGIAFGLLDGEYWQGRQAVDFYYIKGQVQALLKLYDIADQVSWRPCDLPAVWHPGQTAGIYLDNKCLGYVGQLHPAVLKFAGIKPSCFAFEINLDQLPEQKQSLYNPVSKYPAIRRDLALMVDSELPADKLLAVIAKQGGESLQHADVFDVYQGSGIEQGKKSIAVYLILQSFSHTLKDSEVDQLIAPIVAKLESDLGAVLREQ